MARTARVGKLCKRKGTPHIGPDGENNKAKHRRLNQTHSRHRGREEFCRYYRAQLGLSEAEFSEFMGQVSCMRTDCSTRSNSFPLANLIWHVCLLNAGALCPKQYCGQAAAGDISSQRCQLSSCCKGQSPFILTQFFIVLLYLPCTDTRLGPYAYASDNAREVEGPNEY